MVELDWSPTYLAALAAGLLATGAVAGILAGLLGVGGGIVIVPILVYLFSLIGVPGDVAMHLAVGTSLATIIPTSLVSARSHHRRGAVDFSLLRLWAPCIFLGAAAGGVLAKFVDGSLLRSVFGCVALVVALNMASPWKLVLASALPGSGVVNWAISGAIGLLSSLMGVGGGTLSVPTLTLFSVPVRHAVGTSAALGLAIAVPATAGFIWSGLDAPNRPPGSVGYVNVAAAILIFSATVLTAPQGAKLAHAINPRVLKLSFALFLGITAAQMLRPFFTG